MSNFATPEEVKESFKKRLSSLGTLTDIAWTAFEKRMSYLQLEKGDTLIQAGQIEHGIYFIYDGIVRSFVKNQDREISTDFGFKNQFTSSISSFLTQQPSQYTVDTLAPTQLILITHSNLNWMYENFIEINVIGRNVMESLLMNKMQREINLLTLSASERYNKMITHRPKLIENIPLKHLASYLGITSESLSRIRSQKS